MSHAVWDDNHLDEVFDDDDDSDMDTDGDRRFNKSDSDSDSGSDDDSNDDHNDREWWSDENDPFWAWSQQEQPSRDTRPKENRARNQVIVCVPAPKAKAEHDTLRVPAVVNVFDWRNVVTQAPWPELLRYKKIPILDRPLVSSSSSSAEATTFAVPAEGVR